MAVFSTNLYEHVFRQQAPNNSKLRIISGYASATFLQRVIDDFPLLAIELYIGMSAAQGITQKDHDLYMKIMTEHPLIKVYYQIIDYPTHMKIYDFSNQTSHVTFMGSANFSDNGFGLQREVLTTCNTDINDYFNEQKVISMPCDNPQIEKYINITTGDSIPEIEISNSKQPQMMEIQVGVAGSDFNEPIQNYPIKNGDNTKNNIWMRTLSNGKIPFETKFYEFSLEVILDPKNQPLWEYKGVNAWRRKRIPSIRVTNKDYFPRDIEINFYNDDMKFTGCLTGEFNDELIFNGPNVYEFVCQKINVMPETLITRSLLEEYGNTAIKFKRLSETDYYLDF